MKTCNPHLAEHRKRSVALLPQIAELTLLGQSCRQIAAELKVSKTFVHRWQKKLPPEVSAGGSKEVRNRAAESVAERIMRGNARRYAEIYLRAIRAWDRSLAEKKVRIVEQIVGGKAEGAENHARKRSIRTETHAGDSALLTKAIQALKAID
jgi:hypothetical protein